MSRGRVCILSSVHYAFDARIFQKQARSLARHGFEVTLIALDEGTEADTDGVRVLPLPPPQGRLRRLGGNWQLYRLARRQRAAIYAFHDPELLPVGALLALGGACVIYDIHENVPAQIRHKEWLPAPLRPAIARLYQLVERVCLHWIDGLVLAEASYASNYRSHPRVLTVLNYPLLDYIDGADQTDGPAHSPEGTGSEPVLSNPVSANPVSADPEGTDEAPTLVYAGNITPLRGLFTMLEAFTRLSPKHPAARLLIAGRLRPPQAAQEAAAFIDRHRLGERVRLTGRLTHPQIHQSIAAGDIGLALLHPDPNYLESLPTKLFEYMMLGKPVVVSDFPLWKGIVEEVGCGYAVDPLDLDAVCRAIDRLLSDPAGRRRMGQRGRRAVLDRYNWTTQEEKLVRFYQDLLQPAPSR